MLSRLTSGARRCAYIRGYVSVVFWMDLVMVSRISSLAFHVNSGLDLLLVPLVFRRQNDIHFFLFLELYDKITI
jgi:hypothetical protein